MLMFYDLNKVINSEMFLGVLLCVYYFLSDICMFLVEDYVDLFKLVELE